MFYTNWKIYGYGLLFIAFISCQQEKANSIPSARCDKNEISSKYLITAQEAFGLLKDQDHLFIEVTDPKRYASEHISGAINIWRPDFRSQSASAMNGMKCSQSELESLLSSFGVDSKTKLVIYDNKGAVDAMRFKWVLDYYGFHQHKIINGGLKAWKQAGYKTTDRPSEKRTRSNFKLKNYRNESILATIADVQAAIGDSSHLIIDTRDSFEYLGQPFISKGEIYKYKKGAKIHGCIPTSVHLNWSEFSDLEGDHRIKCIKDLEFNLERINATPSKKIIVYCQSGSRSSHTAFVLRELLGYPNVKNYDGSWIEWSQAHVEEGLEVEQKTSDLEIEKRLLELESQL